MPNVPAGAVHEQKLLVTNEVAVDFLGMEAARVLATPWMIAYMEMTARNGILPFLEPGYDTVGTHVDVKHLAATPVGMQVTFRSEITTVDDRRVTCKVEAWDETEKIGDGFHERFIINVERFAARVQAKAAGRQG